MNIIEKLKAQAKAFLKQSKAILETMNEISEWNSLGEIVENIGKLKQLLFNVVYAIEVATKTVGEELKSEEKLEAATQMLDDMIKLPVALEFLDGWFIRAALSWAVKELNERFGNDWPGLGEPKTDLHG